jgi:hypothetical protein
LSNKKLLDSVKVDFILNSITFKVKHIQHMKTSA